MVGELLFLLIINLRQISLLLRTMIFEVFLGLF